MISDKEAYQRYWDVGWLVVESVFNRQEADRVAEKAVEICERDMKAAADKGDGYAVDRSADGAEAPRKMEKPFLRDELFRKFMLDERLMRIVKLLLGKDPLLYSDQLFMKPPRFGSAKPYHQDNAYFGCDPSDDVISSWVALDDVDESNGCVRYIDGSHKGGILPHEPLPDEPYNQAPPEALIDLSKESLAIVGKGGVVFHHGVTLHTSHRNESDRWRRGYVGHWITADVRCGRNSLVGSEDEIRSLDDAHFNSELYPG